MRQSKHRLAAVAVILSASILTLIQTGCASPSAVSPIQVFKPAYQANYPGYPSQGVPLQSYAPAQSAGTAFNQPSNPAWYQQWNLPSFKPTNPFNSAGNSC